MKTSPFFPMRAQSLYQTSADRAMGTRQKRIGRLQEQMATGRRINRASDDATGFAQARRLDVLTSRHEQYTRSIDAARHWTDHTQEALDDLADRFAEAYESGIRGAGGTLTESGREAVARHIEAMRETVIEGLNKRAGDEYLFGGTRTDQPPFDADGNPAAGVGDYSQMSGVRTRQIGPDLEIDLNTSGERLHVYDSASGATIVDALTGLADAVRSSDKDTLEAALEEAGAARDHVIDLGAEAGTKANRLGQARSQLGEATLVAQRRQSEIEDADLAEVMMGLQTEQTGLQATLKVTASVLQTTLLDYLR